MEHPTWVLDDGGHMMTVWQTNTGLPKATQYRTCLHPECEHVEYRDAPSG